MADSASREEISVELSPAWRKEIARRCAEVDADQAELVDADEVFAELYALLDKRAGSMTRDKATAY